MLTTLKSPLVRRDIVTSTGWIIPSPKWVLLSSPITQHDVSNVCTRSVTGDEVESKDNLEGTAFAST
jgi:hypothetical protein